MISGWPVDSEVRTISTSSVGISATTKDQPQATEGRQHRAAYVQVVGTIPIYYTLDGSTADSTKYTAAVGTYIEVAAPSKFRAIRNGASDASLMVTYFTGPRPGE